MASELLGLLEAGFDGSGIEDTPPQHTPIHFGDLFESHGATGWVNHLAPDGAYIQSFVSGAWPVEDQVLAACVDLDWNLYVPLYTGWTADPTVPGIIQRFNADGTSAGRWDRIPHDGDLIDVTDMAYLPEPISGALFVTIGNDANDYLGPGVAFGNVRPAIRLLDANGNVLARWIVDDGGHHDYEYIMGQLGADGHTYHYVVPMRGAEPGSDVIYAFDLATGTQLTTVATAPHGQFLEGLTAVAGGGFLALETRPDVGANRYSFVRFAADGSVLWETAAVSGSGAAPATVATMDYNRQTFWTASVGSGLTPDQMQLRSLVDGSAIGSPIDGDSLPPEGDYTLNMRAANALPLRGCEPGDIFLQEQLSRVTPSAPSGQRRRTVHKFLPDGHLVDVIDIDDAWVNSPLPTNYPTNHASIRVYDVDHQVYTFWRGGGGFTDTPGQLWRAHPLTHEKALLYDNFGNAEADQWRLDNNVTFDEAGNIFVTLSTATPRARDYAVRKFDATGVQIWRKVVDYAVSPTIGPDGYAGGWMLRNNHDMLFNAIHADGWEVMIKADMDQASPITATLVWRMESPYDVLSGPDPHPFFFDHENFMVTDADLTHPCEIFTTAANTGEDDSRPVESAVGIRRRHGTETDEFYYESLTKNPSGLGPPYYDEGWNIDRDQDGQIWISSDGSHNAVNLYQFDRDTGAKLRTITLVTQLGDIEASHYFAICGGQAGHGGCLGVVAAPRRRFAWFQG